MSKLWIAFLVCLWATSPLQAQTKWYVSQQAGSNTNNGRSPSAPFKTPEYAAGALQPGDTLYFMGVFKNAAFNPSYQFSGNINDPHIWTQENSVRINNLNGQPNRYITLKPFDANTVFRGDGANIFRMSNCSYLRIEGFEIYGQVEHIPLSTALALQFVYRSGNSTQSQYRVPPGSTPEQVEQMTLPVLNDATRPSFTDTRGIYFTNVHHLDIIGNHVHHTPGNGFRVSDCDYINIIGNHIHDTSRKSYSGTHGLVVTNATSMDASTGHKIFILRNTVHHNYNEIYSWAPSKTFITPRIDEGKGISMQRNTAGNGWTHGRFLIADNLTYWNGFSGIHSNEGERMDYVNNTCYLNSYTNTVTYAGAQQQGKQIGISAQQSNDFRIFNNICVVDAAWGGFPISVDAMPLLQISHNMVFGLNGNLLQDPDATAVQVNVVVADPQLVNPSLSDFSLMPGSPAIGAANPAYAPTTDYFGRPRDAAPDLGAIEYMMVSAVSEDAVLHNMHLFPNPATERITLSRFAPEEQEWWRVLGTDGRDFTSLCSLHAGGGEAQLDISRLPQGIYLVRTKRHIGRIVKL
ncbi:MAG TPA: choice-of-anchor Q domain-containing protein [Saprospiraceae bacterium]|nr:choice-of-anchor Q domain-containing protein [Saprospiraceae bacterium]